MQPERLPPLPEDAHPRKKSHLPLFLAAAVAVGLLGFGLHTLMAPPDGAAAGTVAAGVPAATDHLTAAQINARAEQFARQAVYPVRAVPATEVQQRVDAMPLDDAAKWQLKNTLLQGAQDGAAATRLVELTLWDDMEEDGDIVMVSSAGYSQQVNLMHAPQTLVFPTIAGNPVTITGVRDGGGGITLGFTGSGVPAALPVLAEGQIVDLYLQ